jgi:predicted dehydrogenase
LHRAALLELFGSSHPVYVLDSAITSPPSNVRLVASLGELVDLGLRDAIYHVTTPPYAHLNCVRDLVQIGAHRIILEKPITSTSEECQELCRLAQTATILPVSVWPNSKVTEQVLAIIESGEIGTVTSIHFEQSKPRFSRCRPADAHNTAFEVELPHQVLLALHLAGVQAHVLSSSAWSLPMPAPQAAVASMGGVLLRLQHAGGVISTLLSDLSSPTRRRHLRVTGTGGEIFADYPISAEDPFGQLRVSGQFCRNVISDAPLSQFIWAAYRYFTGMGPKPPAGLALHSACVDLIETAAELARTDTEQLVVLR